MSDRPNLFEEEDDLDLSTFAPRPAPAVNAPPVDQVRTVTEAARFPSRQAATSPGAAQATPVAHRPDRPVQLPYHA